MVAFKERWSRHSIAVPKLTRTYQRIVKADDWDKDNKKGVHVKVEEMVHANDVYRLKVDGRRTPDRTLWHRGARVGRVDK